MCFDSVSKSDSSRFMPAGTASSGISATPIPPSQVLPPGPRGSLIPLTTGIEVHMATVTRPLSTRKLIEEIAVYSVAAICFVGAEHSIQTYH